MREVVAKVVAAEKEAQECVRAAQAEAARLMEEAQRQVRERTTVIRDAARAAADRVLTEAVQAAEKEKLEALSRATQDIGNEVRMDDADRRAAVAGVVRCVCGET